MDIFNKIELLMEERPNVYLAISGMSCSGKSTLAEKIFFHFSNYSKKPHTSVSIFCQDNYYKNLVDIDRTFYGYLMDSPHAFYLDEFRYDIQHMFLFGMTATPIYDISTNKRTDEISYKWRDDIVIFEGLHTISALIEMNEIISIYLDTDPSLCLKRRIKRDTGKYDIPEKRVKEYWDDIVMPLSRNYIFPQKEIADIIIKSEDYYVS